MNRNLKFFIVSFIGLLTIGLFVGCSFLRPEINTGWGIGAFDSNGERIYFTATSERDTGITYEGGPPGGMMMGRGNLTCASCHGPDAQGGVHTMMGMQTMDAPDIRWAVLSGEIEGEHTEDHEEEHEVEEYTFEHFKLAVVEGKHPDGEPLERDMPRWDIVDQDLQDLAEYLMSLDG